MKIKIVFFYVVILCISLITFFLFNIRLTTKNEEISHLQREYQQCILKNLQNDNQFLDKELVLKKNDGSSCFLDSLIDEPKLIFRYTSLNCNSCVDKQLTLLNRYTNIIRDRILILTYYENLRDLYLFKRLNSLEFETFNIESLNIPFEELQFPYFFVIDENLNISDSFLPLKSDTTLTINYLFEVASKLSNHDYGKHDFISN
jgi:hypothetical protein